MGGSPSEQTVLTEVQDEDEAPRSPDDIILPTIPLRDETEEGRLAAVETQRGKQFSPSIDCIQQSKILSFQGTLFSSRGLVSC